MTKRIPKPHCSKLDRIFACPGSILPTDSPREAGGPDAILGRAKHEVLSYIPRRLPAPVAEIATRFGVDFDELDRAYAIGRRAWDEIGIYFPRAQVERKLESSVCTGTTDVLQAVVFAPESPIDGPCEFPVTRAIRLADWKTGYGTDYHPRQLQGYAYCAVEEFGLPENGVVTVFEIWTTHRQIKTINLTQDELEAFAVELTEIRELTETNPKRLEYRAGRHCLFCPHRPCPTHSDWMLNATTAIAAIDHRRGVTRDMLGRLYLKRQAIGQVLATFDAVVELALDDGPLALPDGRVVDRVETEREKIDAAKAMEVLRERGLSDPEVATLMGDMPKSNINAWAKSATKKGGKAKLLREIYSALRDAGAIREVPYRERKILTVEGE